MQFQHLLDTCMSQKSILKSYCLYLFTQNLQNKLGLYLLEILYHKLVLPSFGFAKQVLLLSPCHTHKLRLHVFARYNSSRLVMRRAELTKSVHILRLNLFVSQKLDKW